MNNKRKKPCGLESCTTLFVVQGEAGIEHDGCPYNEAVWKETAIDTTMSIPATKNIHIYGRNLPNIHITEGDTDSIVARLYGKVNIPGEKLSFEHKTFMYGIEESRQAGTALELKCDTATCPGFTGELFMDVTIPRNSPLEFLTVFGREIIAELPSMEFSSLFFNAAAGVSFDTKALGINVHSDHGTIYGKLTSIGTANALINTNAGNIDLTIKGFTQFCATVSSKETECEAELIEADSNIHRRLMGNIHANTGSVNIH